MGVKFAGTDNTRHLRAIDALEVRPRTRNELGRIVGSSNMPQTIMEIRQRGLEIPCRKIPVFDRDGHKVQAGLYSLSANDLILVEGWKRTRDADKRPPEQQREIPMGDCDDGENPGS